MAANMDAMIRVAAKVQGLNDFKALSEKLLDIDQASGSTRAKFQQLTAESGRLANEAVRSGQSIQRATNNIRELGVVLAPTDQQLAKVRDELVALGAGSKVTERSLNQQIQALKALQSQAVIGGAVYRQLGKDIKALGGAYQEAATSVKTFTDAQRASQIVGAKPGTFGAQVGALKNQLQELSVYGGEYAAKLTEIQRRQLSFNTAMARQGVIADAAAFAQGGKNAGQALPELPNTSAGLSQRLSELNTELVNLTLGGQDWIRVSREIASVQRQLNQEFDKGSTQYKSPIGPAAPSALFQRIAGISDQTGANQLQLMGRSYEDVAESIQRAGAASDGSINSLQRQRAAWQALQSSVNPASPAYDRARKSAVELEEQIRKLTATQQKAARASLGREAFGSALGSLAAGGGFQGAAGALAGGLAFSGGPAGIAAGAAVTGVGAVGALAARVGVDAETAQVRLRALTEEFGEYNEAQASAARIAATLRISQIEAADGLSKLYAALRPTGVTLQEVEDAFIGFTAAARASGATATESSAALLQLKQALGSGVLQGDELRSIREQAPAAAQAIAKEMGVTVGELKKLGSEGKITTDIVLRALARLKGESLGKLNAQFATSGQAMKDLQVATENFGASVARVFGPNTVKLIRGVTTAVEYLGTLMENPFERAKAAQFIGPMPSPGRTAAQQQASDQAARERAAGRARAAAASAPKETAAAQSNLNQLLIDNLRLNTELGNIGKDRISQLNAEIELIPQILKLELGALNTSLKGRDLEQTRINTINEARKRSMELEEELAGVNKEVAGIAIQAAELRVSTLSGLMPQQSPLQEGIQKVKQELLDADKAAEDLLGRLSKLAGTGPTSGPARVAIGDLRGDLASADPNAIASQRLLQGDTDALSQQIAELQAAGRELTTLDQLVLKYGADWDLIDPKIRASVGALAQQKDALSKQVEAAKEMKALYSDIGMSIKDGVVGGIQGAIDGTKSLKEVASDLLSNIANKLLDVAINMALFGTMSGTGTGGGLLGGFFKAANGASFAQNGIQAFAKGGIVTSPTLFKFAQGGAMRNGLMGEAGPEAIMPLRRLPGGRLGVESTGGGTSAPITVMVNVDAKGTAVESNQTEGAQLGRAISAAVQAELVKQQRPGGLLAGTRR